MNHLNAFASLAVAIGLTTLFISNRDERFLKAAGTIESEAWNSKLLALVHTLFCILTIFERCRFLSSQPNALSAIGPASYSMGMTALVIVMHSLGRQWAVKILIAPRHVWVKGGICRHVHHPNYHLSNLPELGGFALIAQAPMTLMIGIRLYAALLAIRIRRENSAMNRKFEDHML